MSEKLKREKRGDRKEGRWLNKLDAFYGFIPFIMMERSDASNYFTDMVEVSEAEAFLRKKRAEGFKGMGMLHLFVAAYVRTISQNPGLNRFVSGQRIYARRNIEIVMAVKKDMAVSGGETTVKFKFEPTDTIDEIYTKMTETIDKVKNGATTNTDNVAGALMKLPRWLLRFALSVIRGLDYRGWLPMKLLDASPFHGSMIITDLGSLGIPPIYHHLYNFGNLPVFMAFGAKRKVYELNKDGAVEEKKYIDFKVVTDERIADGFYYAKCFKYIKSYLRHPDALEKVPETVVKELV